MVISLAARSLLVVVLLSGSRSFAVEKNEDKYQGKTPDVTRAEKSLGFWVVPPIPSPYISSKPSSRNDGVAVGDLVTNGVKSDPADIY